MNVTSTRPAHLNRPAAPTAKPEIDDAQQSEPKDAVVISLPTPGQALRNVAHFAAGTANVVWESPEIIGSPIVNAFNPVKTETGAGMNELWSPIVGGVALGVPVGMALSTLDSSLPVAGGAVFGAIFGGMGGCFKMVASMLGSAFTGDLDFKASMPGVAKAAHEIHEVEDGAYATGLALRTGFPIAAKEAYQNGGKMVDSTFEGTVNFTRGILGLKK